MSSPDASNSQGNEQQTPRTDILPTLFGEGYGIYEVQRGSFVASFLLNSALVGLAMWIGTWSFQHQDQLKQVVTGNFTDISPVVLQPDPKPSGGGGGGGDRDKLLASKGALPKQSMQQITPPAAVIRNEAPKLPVEPTVVIPPQVKLPQIAGNLGDPLSNVMGPASNGTGSGSGIGNGSGGGVGSGTGPGFGPGFGGGTGGGVFRVGGGVSAPKALYAPDPEYSEEARKAKWQGTVVLWVIVSPDGRTRDIKVQRSLGLGLDEKAVEAVRSWKFDPAKKDGQPVAVQINVEVNFRLY